MIECFSCAMWCLLSDTFLGSFDPPGCTLDTWQQCVRSVRGRLPAGTVNLENAWNFPRGRDPLQGTATELASKRHSYTVLF